MKKKYKKELKKIEKENAKQRAKKGYCGDDVWDMDNWFIDIMPRMLKQFRKYHRTHPISMLSAEEQRLAQSGTPEQQQALDKKAADEWDEILDHMIFLLHEMDNEKCSQQNTIDTSNCYEKFQNADGIHGIRAKSDTDSQKKLDAFGQRELELAQYRNQCKDEFFELFSKYFWDLWD